MTSTHAPRPRRELRVGVVQLAYVVVGALLGLALPTVASGPTVAPQAITPLVLGIAGGFISFIALVFSLLFLVVQYGNTTVSPRLTLFRDAPIIWHSFGMFLGVFAYATVAGIQVSTRGDHVTILVPIVAIGLVIVALLLSRSLQIRALHQLQFPATMEEIRRLGAATIERVHRHPLPAETTGGDGPRQGQEAGAPGGSTLAEGDLPPVRTTIVWDRATTTLRQIDGPALLAEARRVDAMIDLHVTAGTELARRSTVATVRADHPAATVRWERALGTGVDRSFAQDPLLAFRLLSDIGNRTLSPAINDPATAVQVLSCVQDLLMLLVDRRLDPVVIGDEHGRPRLRVPVPSWEQYLHAGVDEIAHYGRHAPTVRARLRELLETLLAHAPADRRPALERRLADVGVDDD